MKTYKLSSTNALSTNSSGGKLLKWKIGDTFIKTSTLDTASIHTKFMYESYAEVICSHIAELLGIDCADYKLCRVVIDGKVETIACESQDFTIKNNRKYTFKSIARLMLDNCIPTLGMYDSGLYAKLLSCFNNSTEYEKYLYNNIMIDVLTLNDDRHFGNFGILCSNNGCKIPPIFDNGNSLFCHKHTEGMTYTDDLMDFLRCKPFHPDFNTEAELLKHYTMRYDISKIYKNIRNLVKYMVENQGLPVERGKFILDLLKSRIQYLNGID